MSRLGTWGRRLLGFSVLLIVIKTLGLAATGPFGGGGALAALAPIIELWVVFAVLGLALVVVDRTGIRLPVSTTASTLDRQDIIVPTNWIRNGKHVLRRSFGVALAASAAVLFVVSVVLGKITLAVFWLLVFFVGSIWVVLAWRSAHDVVVDHTETVSVRVPDLFALHSFHVTLRQQVEDLGYGVRQNTSPGQGGRNAAHDNGVFHAKGGFEARKRPISKSRTLVPELEDDTILAELVSVATLGVFVTFLGFTLIATAELADPVGLLGVLAVIFGLAVTGYDYVTRTREWGELYCVEEGSVHSATVNVYSDDVLESMESHVEPTVSAPDTSAVIAVTVGAKCTSLYDQSELEDDFETLVETIDAAVEESHASVVDS